MCADEKPGEIETERTELFAGVDDRVAGVVRVDDSVVGTEAENTTPKEDVDDPGKEATG